MGMWILESRSMEHVPGTTRYFDDSARPQAATADFTGLKCDTSGPVPIILVPQPSDDPNDPLNWPLWKRDGILIILSVTSVFATSLSPILASNTLLLAAYFDVQFTDIALLTGYCLLGTGIGGVLAVPSARIWGKRHLFLLGTLLLTVTSAWSGASQTYSSLLWARIFQGIGISPFEALVNASVGDLYFVHERGKRMALTNLAVFGGAFFTPIVVGKITDTIGWRWSFHFVTIFTGICLPLVFFFVPETAFRRSAHLNTDMASTDKLQLPQKSEETGHGIHVFNGEGEPVTPPTPPTPPVNATDATSIPDPESHTAVQDFSAASIPEKSLSAKLALFSGRINDENYFKLFLRPFPLFAHPGILWACLIQGSTIGWTVFIGVILAAIFIGPPLYWDVVTTGYAYAGAFIGAVAGFAIAGAVADWSTKYMTRRNKGIFEPEFRIVLVIPQFVFGCTGLYLFGITTTALTKYSWAVPIFAFGLEVCGMVIGAVATSLYIVDAHREIAIEGFTCILIVKNFFSFGLTFSAYDWILQAGIMKTFMWISSVQAVLCLLSILMYVFGKKNRSFFHRHDILKLTGLA